MSLESLLKSIKQAQGNLKMFTEVQKELKEVISKTPIEAQKIYHDSTADIFSKIKGGDYSGAIEKIHEGQKRINKITKNDAG